MYSIARSMSPSGLARKSTPGPASPPASSKPGCPGGIQCVGMSPTSGPPNALRSASRSNAAESALRTFGSSNGFVVFLSAM